MASDSRLPESEVGLDKMIAAVLRGKRTIEIEEWPVPEITAEQALVRVRGAAI